ncbi:MAG TPA: energy transducer TonB [Bacteroidales bacterium]|nr:energy transducer TonB [Bacteroidales bacterium]HSA44642.1 energy transducer TonB [Bacteroidales bacterium]
MEKHKSGVEIFSPSGCLTREGMQAVVSGNLDDSLRELAEKHLSGCELCRLAVEGYQAFVEDHGTLAWEQDLVRTNSQVSALVTAESPLPEEAGRKRRHNIIWTGVAVAATITLFLGLAYVIRLWLPLQPEQLAQQTPPAAETENVLPETEMHEDMPPAKPAEPAPSGTRQTPPASTGSREPRLAANAVVAETTTAETDATTSDPLLLDPVATNLATTAGTSYSAAQINSSGTAVNPLSADQAVTSSEIKEVRQEHIKAVSTIEKKASKAGQPGTDDAPAVFYLVEEMPSFPGGQDSLQAYLNRHIQYPLQAREANISGTVQLSFVVDRKGRIRDITVLKGIGMGCDEEAVRVVKNMPRWHAGKQAGKTVDVRFTLPVRFEL